MGKAIHPLLKAKLQDKNLDLETANRIQVVLKPKGPSKPLDSPDAPGLLNN